MSLVGQIVFVMSLNFDKGAENQNRKTPNLSKNKDLGNEERCKCNFALSLLQKVQRTQNVIQSVRSRDDIDGGLRIQLSTKKKNDKTCINAPQPTKLY